MKKMKTNKYHCTFVGIATMEDSTETSNEFNHSEETITALSCQDALSRWLRKMWNYSLKLSEPSSHGNSADYGDTYTKFISSKDVKFRMNKVGKGHIRVNIQYKWRDDFYYEITIIKKKQKK